MAQTVVAARQLDSQLIDNPQSGTTYTFVASDDGKDVRGTNVADKTFTVPSTSVMGAKGVWTVTNAGGAKLSLVPDTGVTLRRNPSHLKQYAHAIIRAIGTDEYIIAPVNNAGIIVSLTDAATIAVDASLGPNPGDLFRVTLGGNRTLGNPTNAYDGQILTFEIIQDGTGSRTLALDTKFAFGSGLTSITFSTGANKHDLLVTRYNASADKFYITGFQPGF